MCCIGGQSAKVFARSEVDIFVDDLFKFDSHGGDSDGVGADASATIKFFQTSAFGTSHRCGVLSTRTAIRRVASSPLKGN